EQVMSARHRDQAQLYRLDEASQRFGALAREADQRLNGREDILDPMIELGHDEVLAFAERFALTRCCLQSQQLHFEQLRAQTVRGLDLVGAPRLRAASHSLAPSGE